MQVHEGSGRAAPWVIALDSRAEILLWYDLQFYDRALQLSGKRNPTVCDFIHEPGRGRLENPWVGSPKDIADRLEEWFTERACDVFVVGPTYLPGTFEEFVWLVIRISSGAASTARSTPEPHCGIISGWCALRPAHGDTDPVPVG
jgi:alkanesulfonate monooxygenase SsuD/methylene tetrahydromethanopterin reductase-like flavin-dependent oxidoreductase (luciferase family)